MLISEYKRDQLNVAGLYIAIVWLMSLKVTQV